jgi:hypothetical protein
MLFAHVQRAKRNSTALILVSLGMGAGRDFSNAQKSSAQNSVLAYALKYTARN